MNEIQQAYETAKAVYDAAVESENWDLVEQVENAYLDAESSLVNWALDVAEKTGRLSANEMDLLRKNWVQHNERIVSLAMKLSA
ncbi:hypothetical protein [Paenibacillus oleatilyticus]|uniref:hypothetical protein n=1 Tax=Paenibacillus oleatilyticus TaxID=2594886 RepID=UPI001C1FC207|nr:hypothetical protein [Paenibacillus oleatilyticus]MBU7318433.1 hypothetical protein [Paenibacillus oleatilyticus]